MRILHLPSTFFPDHTGGKEVFVYNLIRNMPGAEHVVLVHKAQRYRSEYAYDGIRVIALPLPISADERTSYYSLEFDKLSGFSDVIDGLSPDLVHFHDQSSHASLSHLKLCKSKGIKTMVTYHSPGQSCLQRALLLTNQVPCDGKIELTRCTYCRYRIRNISPVAAAIGSVVSLPVDTGGKFLLRNSTKLFAGSWKEFYDLVDAVQIHAEWVTHLLKLNNVDERKIHFVAMGAHASLDRTQWREYDSANPLKLVFVGRCSDSKGIHVLVTAIQKFLQELPIEMHFFGPPWEDSVYGQELLNLVRNDNRFKAPVLLPPNEVVSRLTEMDVCVVPSIWPETGPFTVFDAFAAGLPVVGTRYAGIAERVRHEVDGLLFDWGSPESLAEQVLALIKDPALVNKLKANIQPNRTFEAMAGDFLQLYASILK